MIAIVDYGAGNIRSVVNAFEKIGAKATLVSNAEELKKFDKVVLPGVGAFSQAIDKLKQRNFDIAMREFIASGKPFLGICLGMQLLFESSEEFGISAGLGFLSGKVLKFESQKFQNPLKIPHVGWNTINFTRKTPINKGLKQSEYFYFVHSFHVLCDEKFALGVSEYGYEFVSAVAHENIYGFQPHPEKSHDIGLKLLQNFKEL